MTSKTDRENKYRQVGLWTDERIGWLLSSAAHRWGDQELISIEGARYSFDALNRWVIATAHDLIAHGVRPGDHVLLQLGNCIELLALQCACWRIGAVSVPVIPIYRAHEVRAIIEDTKPVLIATACTLGTRRPCGEIDDILTVSGHRPRAKLLVGDDTVAGWTAMNGPPSAGQALSDVGLPDPAHADDCCIILFTSGTTAAPKGVKLSSHQLLANVEAFRETLGLSSSDVFLGGTPLTHIAAFLMAVLLPLKLGARSVVMASWNADRAIELIENEGATLMAGATLFLRELVERYEKGAGAKHRLDIFVCGGAAIPPTLIERAEAMGVYALRNYGMTETCGAVALPPKGSNLQRRAYNDGRVLFGAEIEIADDQHHALPFGELGHIRLRAPHMMLGYTNPDLDAQQIDAEGWFYPGDMGTLTAEGWLTVTGRTKDIINRGGEKFSSQDIEAVLSTFPDVRSAAVVGVPDERFGEAVGAFLLLREGACWNGPAGMIAHLEKTGMAKQKFPVEWHILDEFPATASGKIQKQKLLEMRTEKSEQRAMTS